MLWNYHQVKEYYKKLQVSGKWPENIPMVELLDYMKEVINKEGFTLNDHIWHRPEGYDNDNYDRAMKGL